MQETVVHFEGLQSPLVNRRRAVIQVLQNFIYSYSTNSVGRPNVRSPCVSFAPHGDGIGKSCFGVNFRQLVLANREFISEWITRFPGFPEEENVGATAVEALLNETLYVTLNLCDLCSQDDFATSLVKAICTKAVSQLPNSSELLSQLVPCSNLPKEWVRRLLQLTNMRYLYVFIDEVGCLERFRDRIAAKYSEEINGNSKLYGVFFRILAQFLDEPYTICVLAGRMDRVYVRSASISLKLISLDPFSEDTVKYFIQRTTVHDNRPILSLLFPCYPEGPGWFFRQVFCHTGGVPKYVFRVLKHLLQYCTGCESFSELSDDLMKKRMLEFVPVHQRHNCCLTPKGTATFCAMLLASISKFSIPMRETFSTGAEGNSHSEYVLDVANRLGFYWTEYPVEEYSQTHESFMTHFGFFRLIFPRIILRHVGKEYWDSSSFGSSLFELINRMNLSSMNYFKVEAFLGLVLCVRWSLCDRLGQLSIFRDSVVESLKVEPRGCTGRTKMRFLVKFIPAFRSLISGMFADGKSLCSLNHWVAFYDRHLCCDGIFFPLQENFYGPDVLVRISNTRDTFASSKEKKENQSEEANVEKNIVYLIGISWESCASSDISSSRAMVKEKIVNFIYPVSAQSELEKNDIRVTQFIVGDKYSECLFERFSCDRKWILCSGSYYEDDLGGLEYRHLLFSEAGNEDDREWLKVPAYCQVVILSPELLQELLDSTILEDIVDFFADSQEWLDEGNTLYMLLENSIFELLKLASFDNSEVYFGFSSERNVRPKRDAELVDDSLKENSFDWNSFLRENCGFSEEQIAYCLSQLSVIGRNELDVVTSDILFELGIDDARCRLKILVEIQKFLDSIA